MKKIVVFFFLICVIQHANAQLDVPYKWSREKFSKLGLSRMYEIDNYVKPTVLQADFNGDNITDIAYPVLEKTSKKKGLIIFHANTDNYFVLGAGKKFEAGGDDFSWANRWEPYKKKSAKETVFTRVANVDVAGRKPVKLSRPGLRIVSEEGSGFIVYWDGKKYTAILQGK